jgi:hypothetical protein
MEILSVQPVYFTETITNNRDASVLKKRQTHVSPSLDSIMYATHVAKSTSMWPTYVLIISTILRLWRFSMVLKFQVGVVFRQKALKHHLNHGRDMILQVMPK